MFRRFKIVKLILFVYLIQSVNLLSAQNLNLDSLYKTYNQLRDDSTKVRLLRELGEKLEDSDSTREQKIYLECIALSKKINDEHQEGRSLNSLGIWHYDLSHFDDADSILRMALIKSQRIKDRAGESKNLVGLGNVFYSTGAYDSAISYYFSAVRIVEELKDYKRVAAGYSNISSLYYVLDDVPNAKVYVKKANAALKLTEDERGLGRNYSTMARIYAKELLFDSAIYFSEKAIRLLRKTNDLKFLQIAYGNVATNFYDKKMYTVADLYCDSSLALASESGNINGLFYSLMMKGKLAMESKKFIQAGKLFDEALPYAMKDGNILWKRYYYENKKLLAERQNNFKDAYNFLQLYNEFNDSIKNIDKLDKMAELDTKYQSEMKQAQIKQMEKEREVAQITFSKKVNMLYFLTGSLAFLTIIVVLGLRTSRQKQIIQGKQIRELEQEKQLIAASSIMKGQEDERSRMAKDLHDGLGGMLSGIKLNLSSMKGNIVIQERDTQLFVKSINQLDNAIAEMRRLAHNMMPEALLKFGLIEAIGDFCDGINESNSVKIKFEHLGPQLDSEKSTEVILYRIIQELSNNAIKHAEAHNIFIQLTNHDNGISLSFEDDGKGFDTTLLKLNKGTGLLNVQSRVDYLKGKLEIQSKPGSGTSVIIEIPK